MYTVMIMNGKQVRICEEAFVACFKILLSWDSSGNTQENHKNLCQDSSSTEFPTEHVPLD